MVCMFAQIGQNAKRCMDCPFRDKQPSEKKTQRENHNKFCRGKEQHLFSSFAKRDVQRNTSDRWPRWEMSRLVAPGLSIPSLGGSGPSGPPGPCRSGSAGGTLSTGLSAAGRNQKSDSTSVSVKDFERKTIHGDSFQGFLAPAALAPRLEEPRQARYSLGSRSNRMSPMPSDSSPSQEYLPSHEYFPSHASSLGESESPFDLVVHNPRSYQRAQSIPHLAQSSQRSQGPQGPQAEGLGVALSAFGPPAEWWHDSVILGRLSALALRFFATKAMKTPWNAWLQYVQRARKKSELCLQSQRRFLLQRWHRCTRPVLTVGARNVIACVCALPVRLDSPLPTLLARS